MFARISRHAAPHDACLRSPITSQVHRGAASPKMGFSLFAPGTPTLCPNYRAAYSGDRVMLVYPGSRTVVQEVD